jgi:hypothetical protein
MMSRLDGTTGCLSCRVSNALCDKKLASLVSFVVLALAGARGQAG